MEYPEDRSARNVELEYFLGDSLLVVPVFDQEDEIDVYLPNGQWIDLFTHERIKGGRWVVRYILVLVCMKNIKQKDKVY